MGDSVSDDAIADFFDTGDDITYLPRLKRFFLTSLGEKIPTSPAINVLPETLKMSGVFFLHFPVKNPDKNRHAAVIGIFEIKDKRLKRFFIDIVYAPLLARGIRLMTSFKRFSTPSPVLPETSMISFHRIFKRFAISSFTSSVLASGESILLTTGIMTRFDSCAIRSVVSVCACTPCVASTSKIEPSTALSARETS